MGSLRSWTITSLHAEYASQTTCALTVFKTCLKEVQKTKHLNAYVTVTADLGNAQADAVDSKKAKSSCGSLRGIPIAVKDNFCVRDIRTTCGSRMLADFKPSYSATVVQRLFAAGAALVGKTNLDEFAMGSGCVDSIHGATLNAHDSSCISGGSSGGSAVAVASGTVVAALGSDTGGSTRNPASYNGIVGLKPTYGRVSRFGLIPLVNSMDVPGILTRTVDDAAKVLNVVSGWDRLDSTTVKQAYPPLDIPDNPNIRGLKVGIPKEYYTDKLSSDVVEKWKEIAQLLSIGGAELVECSLPNTQHSIVCYSVLNQCEVASNMARYDGLQYGFRGNSVASTEQLYAQSRAIGLGPVVRRRILCGNYFLLNENYDRYFLKALRLRRLISDDFQNVWNSGIDVLLTPVTLSDAITSKEFNDKDSRAQSSSQDYCTQPANMAGIPAVAVPVGTSKRDLPLSLQVMAPNFREDIMLNVAKYIEKNCV